MVRMCVMKQVVKRLTQDPSIDNRSLPPNRIALYTNTLRHYRLNITVSGAFIVCVMLLLLQSAPAVENMTYRPQCFWEAQKAPKGIQPKKGIFQWLSIVYYQNKAGLCFAE